MFRFYFYSLDILPGWLFECIQEFPLRTFFFESFSVIEYLSLKKKKNFFRVQSLVTEATSQSDFDRFPLSTM